MQFVRSVWTFILRRYAANAVYRMLIRDARNLGSIIGRANISHYLSDKYI